MSLITNLTVESIKKFLNERGKTYSSNILAAVVSLVVSLAVCFGYVVLTNCEITPKVIVEILAVMYLGFLIATVGYDKVVQTIAQLRNKDTGGNQNE